MTINEDVILAELHNHRTQIMRAKNDEYATVENRYYNFEKGAEILERMVGLKFSKELIAQVYLTKHLASIDNLWNAKNNEVTKKLIMEKYGDALNYLDILEDMWKFTAESNSVKFYVSQIDTLKLKHDLMKSYVVDIVKLSGAEDEENLQDALLQIFEKPSEN